MRTRFSVQPRRMAVIHQKPRGCETFSLPNVFESGSIVTIAGLPQYVCHILADGVEILRLKYDKRMPPHNVAPVGVIPAWC